MGACALACGVAVAEPAEVAERAGELAATAIAAQGHDRWTLAPEVSAVRTPLAPSASATPVFGTDGRPMTEIAGVNYRLWLSHGRAGVGVGVGTVGYVQSPADGRSDGVVTLSGAVPTIAVGMRYRMTSRSSVYADAWGGRGLPPDTNEPYLGTKVGLEWKPAKSDFGFERGTIGVQLDSGYKLSLKPRRGGLGIYLRGQF